MGLFDEVTEDNLIIFAAKHYYNPKCIDAEEFYEDLNRFKYIKRLVNKYLESGKISERLILNHLIIIFNTFGIEPSLKMLNLKMDDKHWPVIKPFLVFLRYIKNDELTGIEMDQKVIEMLRKI
jgi:hypothetical protein